MTTWFTSDTHYYHENIIKYCARPFHDKHHMNETLIERWNARVRLHDLVYHVGDFGFSKEENLLSILDRLAGRKVLIAGNHDKVVLRHRASLFHGRFEAILDKVLLADQGSGGQDIELCHYPIYDKPGRSLLKDGGWMLHGHKHGQGHPRAYRMLDVGVDVHGFQPISLDEVSAIMASKVDYAVDGEAEEKADEVQRASRRR